MLSFVNTQQQFIGTCNKVGINPQITAILAKIKDHTEQSVSVLTDTISLIVKRGNSLLPSVEIHCNLTGDILTKTSVGFWECECEFLAIGYSLLEQCHLDDSTLHEAQETLNMLMCGCSSCNCE